MYVRVEKWCKVAKDEGYLMTRGNGGMIINHQYCPFHIHGNNSRVAHEGEGSRRKDASAFTRGWGQIMLYKMMLQVTMLIV